MLGRNLDDAEEWVRSWSAQVSGGAEAAAALADRVAGLASSATGDGVRVTVASSGNVTALELTDRVQRLSAADLSAEILRVMRRAQAGLSERVADAVDETVGADTETGRAVLDSFAQRFPGEPDDEPAAPVMPSPPPFPTFQNRPSLPHQAPGGGFESGRDSRAR
ncbi:hypothetical protein [Jidongwangia harbinensis]|uniref:hypothetical protein n=1 Tax=Jidongwangia harbinensis TaxID=2878561 RepID=UPI001CD947DE|nr:hypothetical protein [Jidongwangia harbinensis]MCA2215364.1 hypothetical protein [Jidongwangia harbinensis]